MTIPVDSRSRPSSQIPTQRNDGGAPPVLNRPGSPGANPAPAARANPPASGDRLSTPESGRPPVDLHVPSLPSNFLPGALPFEEILSDAATAAGIKPAELANPEALQGDPRVEKMLDLVEDALAHHPALAEALQGAAEGQKLHSPPAAPRISEE